MSTKGTIGKWDITDAGFTNTDGTAYIIARDTNSYGTAEARIGTNVFPATSGVVGVGYFENSKINPYGTNYGAVFSVTGGMINIAAEFTGYIKVNTGFIIDGNKIPITASLDYEVDGDRYNMKFKHGLLYQQGRA